MTSLRTGTPLHFDHGKWDGPRHWQADGSYLGADEWGHWAGVRAGARIHRPGHEYRADVDQVQLTADHPWVARFYDRPAVLDSDPDKVQVYVDISSVPEWHLDENPARVSLTDLDLDVVHRGETTFIDDEDEFATHRVTYGYPTEMVARCEATAAEVLRAVTERTGPFAPGVAEHWFAVFRGVER